MTDVPRAYVRVTIMRNHVIIYENYFYTEATMAAAFHEKAKPDDTVMFDLYNVLRHGAKPVRLDYAFSLEEARKWFPKSNGENPNSTSEGI